MIRACNLQNVAVCELLQSGAHAGWVVTKDVAHVDATTSEFRNRCVMCA